MTLDIPPGVYDNEKFWFDIALHIITGVDMLVQLYNAFVCVYVTDRSIKTYRYFILWNTIADLLYIVSLGVVLQPTTLAIAPCMSMHGPLHGFGMIGAEVAWSITGASVVLVVASQACALFYRMVVLLQQSAFEQTILSKLGIADSFEGLFLSWWGISLCVFLHLAGAGMLAAGARMVLSTGPWDFKSPKYAGFQGPHDDVYLCMKFDFDLSDWYRVIGIGLVFFVAVVLVVLMIATALAIYAKLHHNKKSMTMSDRTYRMHLLFTRLLLVQTAGPIFCFMVPAFLALIVVFLKSFNIVTIPRSPITGLVLSEIALLLLAIFPLINGFLTARFIAPYWKFTKELMRRVLRRPPPQAEGIVNVSPTQSIADPNAPPNPVENLHGRRSFVIRGLLPRHNGRIAAPR